MTTFKAQPFQEAVDYLRAKGLDLRPSHDWRDMWQEAHATAFTVAKSAGFDILKDVHQAVAAALEQGWDLKQFSRALTPVLQAKGWWGKQEVADPLTGEKVMAQLGSPRRLRIIYDTNMRMAYAAGRWAQMERLKARRPFLRYVAILDGRTRPLHRQWHGTVLPMDHAWWRTHYPPNGWRCRCTVQQLSQRDLDEFGYQVSPDPDDTLIPWTNDRTGEVQMVPKGVDPGFAYNPGRAALDGNAAAVMAGKLVDAPPALGASMGAAMRFAANPLRGQSAAWLSERLDALEQGNPIQAGGRIVIGALGQDVVDYCMPAGRPPRVALESAAITVSDAGVVHMYNAAKRATSRGVPRDVLERLADVLANPDAIFLDAGAGRDPVLLYVVDLGEREGKFVVQLNQARKERGGDGARRRIVTNEVWSASVLSRGGSFNPGEMERIR